MGTHAFPLPPVSPHILFSCAITTPPRQLPAANHNRFPVATPPPLPQTQTPPPRPFLSQLSNPSFASAKAAYQGVPGAYSEVAARKACPDFDPLPCDQFEVAFQVWGRWGRSLGAGQARWGGGEQPGPGFREGTAAWLDIVGNLDGPSREEGAAAWRNCCEWCASVGGASECVCVCAQREDAGRGGTAGLCQRRIALGAAGGAGPRRARGPGPGGGRCSGNGWERGAGHRSPLPCALIPPLPPPPTHTIACLLD